MGDVVDPRLTWLIEPEMWSVFDQQRAHAEGWTLIDIQFPGTAARIARILNYVRSERMFISDLQAAEYVLERVHQGSLFHERAWKALVKAQMHGARDREET